MQSRYLEILDFTQFFDHFVFIPNTENVLEKELKREIPVSVGIELVVVDIVFKVIYKHYIHICNLMAERRKWIMGYYMIRKDFLELKQLYEDGKTFLFEDKLSHYTVEEIIDFSQYFSLNIKNKDEYYNVKMIAEIMYNLMLKMGSYYADNIMEYAKNVIGRCMVLSVDRQAWNDVKKYSKFLLNYATDEDEIYDLENYLGLAYFYMGYYEQELEIRKKLLDYDEYLSLYNYALALFHNKKYEDARVYYKKCLEKCDFPPAYRNQAQISIVLESNYEEAYLLVKKATNIYQNNPTKFNIIDVHTYVEHQFFLCGVCSSEILFNELGIYKKDCEDKIKNNIDVERNSHYLNLINICCSLNRAIRYFERMDYIKSFELLNSITNDKDSDIITFNDKDVFENSVRKIAQIYILLIKILRSFDLVFSETMTEENLDNKICKIDLLRNEILSSEDNDFVYEYKKVILLFLKYIKAFLIYLYKGNDDEIIKIYEHIDKLRIKNNNYLLSTLMQCLFKLGTIYKEYEYNSEDCYFIDELRNKSINKIRVVCGEFSGKIREIVTSVSVIQEDTICTDDIFCKLVIRAMRHIKNNVPNYVRKFKTKDVTTLHEGDFRETLAVFFSSIFSVSSEEWKKEGRTDLIVNTNKNDRRVIEFKIWGRNDYKEVVEQIVERYLNQFDYSGYIFMVNSQKSSIKDRYLENIKNEKTGYVLNSLQIKSTDNIEYFISKHRTEFNEYKIYHFIYNIFD